MLVPYGILVDLLACLLLTQCQAVAISDAVCNPVQDYPLDPAGNMSHHHHYHQQCRASCGSSLSLPSEFPPSPEPHHSSTVWPAQASHDPIMSSSCGTASVEGPATPLSPPAKPCKTSILSIPDHAAGVQPNANHLLHVCACHMLACFVLGSII